MDAQLRQRTAPTPEPLVRKLDDGRKQCLACGHRCRIQEGHPGVCRVRFVENGILRRPHGYVGAVACDPIEKKPFYHAFPAREALTFGMLGCDLRCPYCQNWDTSQVLRDADALGGPTPVSAEALAQAAQDLGAAVVVSSYNEPLITADWAVEVFAAACDRGLHCGFVSNGNATPEVLRFLRPFCSLYKVDLKGFTDKAYRELGGKLHTVLATIEELKRLEFWVEIVTLLVPGFNDSAAELTAMARFLAGIDRDMPWHITAFRPDYRMTDRDRTPVRSLLRAYDIGRECGLRYVYPGNAAGRVGDREHTHCPDCDAINIRRRGFFVLENRMRDGHCFSCGTAIPGVWESAPPRKTIGTGAPRRVPLA